MRSKLFSLCAALAAALVTVSPSAARAAPAPAKPAAAKAAPKPAAKAAAKPAAKASAPSPGRLVLFISIDQLRYQDLLLLAPEFGEAGFAGLGRPLAMRYDTAVTETAADHATLATGTWAELHGVVANRWVEGGRYKQAIDDPGCPIWERPDDGRGASALRVPTVGDALKLASAGKSRVVSVANKDRVALFLGGTGADLALFWDDAGGRFTSTTCYAKAAPDWVVALRQEHPISEYLGYVWTPSRPLEQLGRYCDLDAPAVVPKGKVGAKFPHEVGQHDPGQRLWYALRQTPAATTLALSAAKAAVEAYQLGGNGTTDLLELGIASVDGVGHQFGAHSPERIDTLLRLHDELGAFLSWLRGRLGGRLSVVLTADHGLQPIPAQSQKLHLDAKALSRDELSAQVERALTAQLGEAPQGGWIDNFDPPYLTLKRTGNGDLDHTIHLAALALRKEPGLWKVVETARALEGEGSVPGFARHSLFAGRSGDLLLIPRPLYMLLKQDDGADHGTPWNDDALVPFLAQAPGWSVRPAFEGGVLSATQVAPTVAALLEVSPPAAAFDQPVLFKK
jgi:Type I phosphodiesterase / nucleotide pyrophosphatase